MIVVADAGPLIALARIAQFGLLPSLYGQLCVPPTVRDEVVILERERSSPATSHMGRR